MLKSREINDASSLAEVVTLLKSSKLPYKDLSLTNSLIVAYHNSEGELIGSGGLEFYSHYSLLRSVAVAESQRGKSVGKQIVGDLLDRAKARSITKVFLLTETAHEYFLKFGFEDISRDGVPTEVQSSSEFSSVCPVSAACMVYDCSHL